MSPAIDPRPSGFKVLQKLGGDSRVEAVVARVPGLDRLQVIRVWRPEAGVDPELFLRRARLLEDLAQESLRPVRGSGRMPDGRPYILCDLNDAPTLARAGILSAEDLMGLGRSLAQALLTLHRAGLRAGGRIAADDVALGSPATLDAWQCVLGAPDASESADVQALSGLLLAHAVPEADAGPLSAQVRAAFQSAGTAMGLWRALEQLAQGWSGTTAISSGGTRSSARDPEVDLTGSSLGPWTLERILGEGAMGRVYLARHQRIGRQAAVKVLKADHARNAELVQRFIQEATAVNAIKSEHIVEISDFGELSRPDGTPLVYCVMELLVGRSLAAAMDEGHFSIQRATRVGRAIALALHDAHRVGVVHRDIKPDNIFLQQRGTDPEFVKVLDFGVAKLLKPIGDMPQSGTQAGVVIGTPDYMAPEQALGEPSDFRVDLYALGVVLYQLVSGRRPFEASTFGQLLVELTTKPVPPLESVTPSGERVPEPVRAAIHRCLEREPSRRFGSALELAEVLEPYSHSGFTREFPVYPEKRRLPRWVRRFGWLALPATALVAMLAWALLRLEPSDAGGAAAAGPESSRGPGAASAVVLPVWLDVKSSPPNATVRDLDDMAVLGTTPLQLQLRPRPKLSLRLELEGYAQEQRDVPFQSNAQLVVELTKLAKGGRRTGPKRGLERPPVGHDKPATDAAAPAKAEERAPSGGGPKLE